MIGALLTSIFSAYGLLGQGGQHGMMWGPYGGMVNSPYQNIHHQPMNPMKCKINTSIPQNSEISESEDSY